MCTSQGAPNRPLPLSLRKSRSGGAQPIGPKTRLHSLPGRGIIMDLGSIQTFHSFRLLLLRHLHGKVSSSNSKMFTSGREPRPACPPPLSNVEWNGCDACAESNVLVFSRPPCRRGSAHPIPEFTMQPQGVEHTGEDAVGDQRSCIGRVLITTTTTITTCLPACLACLTCLPPSIAPMLLFYLYLHTLSTIPHLCMPAPSLPLDDLAKAISNSVNMR